MAINQDEMQSIVNAVLSAIRTNSRTIDQLTPVTSLSDQDSFEINGGKRVPFALLRELIIALESEARSKSIAELNKRLNSIVGESASDAIDNYNEIISFLEGIKDDEKLYSKILALQQAVWPLEVAFNVSPKTVEIGVQTNITTSWSVKRNGENVLAQSKVTLATQTTSGTVTGSQKSTTLAPTAPGTSAFTLQVEYQGMLSVAIEKVSAVYPSYFGKVGADEVVTADIVTALTKVIQPSKAMTQTGLSLSNQRLCFAYPKSFGALSSVKDGNNFETLTAYSCSEATVNGVAYYVYTMVTPVTASGVKQIYS